MSDERPQEHISKKRAVYAVPGMERAPVRRDVVYRTTDAGPLTMDIYHPAEAAAGSRLPVVVFIAGYSDVGCEKVFGVRFKEMAMIVSWAQLVAASGLAAIAYANREPAGDLDALLEYLRANAASLGIDETRIGVWASSGNVPLALGILLQARHDFLKCGALLYGYMLDLDGAAGVADAAQMYRFTNPTAGRSVDDLRTNLPLFVVRAGLEQFAGLNDSIDRFVAKAVALNRPITLVNHATGPHAFDLLDDSPASCSIIRQVLGFLKAQLTRAGS
jgi:hypothetical protein